MDVVASSPDVIAAMTNPFVTQLQPLLLARADEVIE
jgi:hypothetical protein